MKFVDIRAESSQIIVRPAMPADYAAFVAGYAGCGPAKTALTRDGLTFPL